MINAMFGFNREKITSKVTIHYWNLCVCVNTNFILFLFLFPSASKFLSNQTGMCQEFDRTSGVDGLQAWLKIEFTAEGKP